MHKTRVEVLKRQVADALASGQGLVIRGAGTRGVDWTPAQDATAGLEAAPVLELGPLTGVIDWQPEELVIAVAAGTPWVELEAVLAERGQRPFGEAWLPASASTVGGGVATGYSGPGRPWLGSVSDGVLGVRLLCAPGGRLVDGRFGGRVIKNVAGFDVSRLQVGACGVFGVLLEVNLRVAPMPACLRCLWADLGTEPGLARMLEVEPPAWPVSGAALEDDRLHLRLEGEPAVVEAAIHALGSEFREESPAFWQELRAGRLPLRHAAEAATTPHAGDAGPEGSAGRHWRVAVPRGTPPLVLPGRWVIDWGGALQWWRTPVALPVTAVLKAARAVGGQALPAAGAAFACLSEDLLALHHSLAHELDPAGCFNPGLLTDSGGVGRP